MKASNAGFPWGREQYCSTPVWIEKHCMRFPQECSCNWLCGASSSPTTEHTIHDSHMHYLWRMLNFRCNANWNISFGKSGKFSLINRQLCRQEQRWKRSSVGMGWQGVWWGWKMKMKPTGTGEDECNFCRRAGLYFESTTLTMSSVSGGHGTE